MTHNAAPVDIPRPQPGDHAPYAITYVNATADALAARGDENLLGLLRDQPAMLEAMLAGRDPAIAVHAYAPGKWTLAESLVHLSDSERVFAYRLLRIARGDATPLAGFEQDDWVPESRAAQRSLEDVVAEFRAVRAASVALVASLDALAVSRVGTASDQRVSARALVWMIAGHAAHHLRIAAERYLAEPVGG